jgi:hypothetical protein
MSSIKNIEGKMDNNAIDKQLEAWLGQRQELEKTLFARKAILEQEIGKIDERLWMLKHGRVVKEGKGQFARGELMEKVEECRAEGLDVDQTATKLECDVLQVKTALKRLRLARIKSSSPSREPEVGAESPTAQGGSPLVVVPKNELAGISIAQFKEATKQRQKSKGGSARFVTAMVEKDISKGIDSHRHIVVLDAFGDGQSMADVTRHGHRFCRYEMLEDDTGHSHELTLDPV